MRARDIGVSVVAAAAALLALRGTPDVDIQLRWMVGERPLPREGNLPVPLPLVTDLDGDGKVEVVVLADGGMTIRVLSVPAASGEILVDPWILHEAELAPLSKDSDEKRAVAMAAGYLDPPTDDRDYSARSRQTQRLVVVRKDWSVVCFDHKLQRLWARDLKHEGSPVGKAASSFVIDQVAITVTHSVRKLDDRGLPKAGTAEGLVIVGGSMRHRDGHFHHSRAGKDLDPRGGGGGGGAGGDVDPLGVHVEAFVEGEEDSRDAVEEEAMSEEEKTRRAAQHFSLFALDGFTGDVRWQHGGDSHVENHGNEHGAGHGRDEADSLKVNLDHLGFGDDFFDGDEAPGSTAFESLAAAAGVAGGGGGRRYRRSLLRHLPHYWSAPSDTRLEITALRRRGPGTGSSHAHLSGTAVGLGSEEKRSRAGSGERRSLPSAAAAALERNGGAGGPDEGVTTQGAGGGGLVRVVLARTREGLEAVELSTGRPLSAVALPAAGSGAGVYVDLNGDGVVDHVQAVGTRGGQGWGNLHSGVAMGHLSGQDPQAQQARWLPPCYALAVSGLPPREQLFNGSLCHDAGALFEIKERLSKSPTRSSRSLDVEVGATPPAILQRRRWEGVGGATVATRSTGGRGAATGPRNSGLDPRSDVVFAVSNGVVSSYDDEGHLNWQDRRGPTWVRQGPEDDANSIAGYVVPFTLEVGRPSRGRGRDDDGEKRILVVGQDKMCVYDRAGRLVGSTTLVVGPAQRPVVGDFDGDGMADVLVVGWGGAAAGYAVTPDPGIRALFVAVLLLAAAMLVVAAVHVPPPSSSSYLSARSSSRDGGRGGGGGGGRRLPGGKSKRATD